ncbi:unnamed protein product (mitochondrion) [Plasmodiophora brassicae]|uniref:Uncharacterized protein n=1 Tax=Plasmodiophora brassicae TaxID=37360 RepID=A0A3P3YHN9_PLABS|nr:unnamed protein product [Plasmodiophora brassicae]
MANNAARQWGSCVNRQGGPRTGKAKVTVETTVSNDVYRTLGHAASVGNDMMTWRITTLSATISATSSSHRVWQTAPGSA